MCLKEEEALAQALSHADMGPGEELTPEEEEELRYPGENQRQSSLEQVNAQHNLNTMTGEMTNMMMMMVEMVMQQANFS